MTKKNTTTHETSPEVLDPVSVETTTDQHSISVPPGHVYILALKRKAAGSFIRRRLTDVFTQMKPNILSKKKYNNHI